uniref:hypothetical protein n=1 Tax=Methylobacterium sp. B34 TaxID=95563 RepID=UPI000346A9A2|nr:hypothetical protein [Methylobacterium sp. B34]
MVPSISHYGNSGVRGPVHSGFGSEPSVGFFLMEAGLIALFITMLVLRARR